MSCAAHAFHSPRPQAFHTHRILPVEWGGAEDGPSVSLCPTGHENIHHLLTDYMARGETPPWDVRRSYGPGERALASEAWRLYREVNGG